MKASPPVSLLKNLNSHPGETPDAPNDEPAWEPVLAARTRTIDALAGFETMAKHAEPEFAPTVEAYRDLHRRHAEDLTRLLGDNQVEMDEQGSFMGTVNRMVVSTRALFDEIDADILSQIHSGEEHVISAYEDALASGICERHLGPRTGRPVHHARGIARPDEPDASRRLALCAGAPKHGWSGPARGKPSGESLTCHGIFPPSTIRVRPMERTDDEEGTTDVRADQWHPAGA